MADVTVGPSGRDYPTLAAAEAGEEGDLSTIGPLNFLCDAFTDTTPVSFNGWTNPSATNFITVTPASGAEHGGVPGQGYILDVSSGGSAFYCNVGYMVVTGITIDNDSGFAFSFGGVSSPVLKNCIINGGTSYTVSMTGGASIEVINNRIVGGTRGIYCARFIVEMYNNTVVGASITGIESTQNSANVIIKNNVSVDSTTSDFNLHANTTVSNNASGDTTATGTGAVTGISTSDGVDFVEPSTGNYRPSANGALFGAGADLSSEGVTTDIRNETITEWSIGAYDTYYILRTVKSSNGDYSSLSAWEAGEQTDLVAAGDQHIVECYDDWPGGLDDTIKIEGWTTDNLYGDGKAIIVRPATNQGHDGYDITTGFYIKSTSATPTYVFSISQGNVTAEQIGFDCSTGNGGRGVQINHSSLGSSIVKNLIVENPSTTSAIYLLGGGNSNTKRCEAWNCLVKKGTGTSVRGFDNSGIGFGYGVFYNCTAIGNFTTAAFSFGRSGYSLAEVKNCVAVGSSGIDFESLGTDDIDYCATTEINAAASGLIDTGNNVFNISTADGVDFVEPSTGNYQPTSTGALAGTGTDLSSFFTDDITGATRSTPWDIGAYIAAGGGPVTIEEMYIRTGGVFQKHTPHVKVGTAWQEVDAYVKSGGVWVQVHEKP